MKAWRMRGDPCDMHHARVEFHHNQHIGGHQAMPGGDLHGEEVRRREDFPMELEKLCPAHAPLAPFGRGIDVVAAQNVPYRDDVDVMPQIRQSTLNALVALPT